MCGVYKVDESSFPDDLMIKDASVNQEGTSLLTKHHGDIIMDHVTTQPLSWLRSHCYCTPCLNRSIEKSDVISRHIASMEKQGEVPTMDYDQIVDCDEGLFKLLEIFMEYGFCRVRNVPTQDKMLLKFGSMIGPVQTRSITFNNMFNVVSTNSLNAAFSTQVLPLHMDQHCYENVPGIQILHALKFDPEVSGGENTLVDLFQAAEILRKESPEDFQTLCEVPGCFAAKDYKTEKPVYLEIQKTHIVVDYFGKISAINWHPGYASASTLRIKEQDVERFYKARKKFANIINRPDLTTKYNFRLESGDLIIFNNRRVAHAREEFHLNGGNRHLQGCYLCLDDAKGKYMTLAKKLGLEVTPPKTGNRSSI